MSKYIISIVFPVVVPKTTKPVIHGSTLPVQPVFQSSSTTSPFDPEMTDVMTSYTNLSTDVMTSYTNLSTAMPATAQGDGMEWAH